MKTAVLAVIVAADVGLSAEDIAENYDMSVEMVEKRLNGLEAQGHVEQDGPLYYATDEAQKGVIMRSRATAAVSRD